MGFPQKCWSPMGPPPAASQSASLRVAFGLFRTLIVEVKLNNANQKVRPGMFARAILNYGTKDHVVVPDLAIVKQSGSGDRYVFVYKDGKVSYNKVELGRRMGDEYELLSGVENNSQVVIAGQSRIFNGVEVQLAQE